MSKDIESLMKVTSFKSWVVLAALGVVLGGVITWSIVAWLPERIEGKGKIQTVSGTQDIASPGEGILEELTIKEGDRVEVGQEVGKLRSARIDAKVIAARREYDEVLRRYQSFVASEEAALRDLREQRGRRVASLRDAQDYLRNQEQLLVNRQTTNQAVDQARTDVAIKRAAVDTVDKQLAATQAGIGQRKREVDVAQEKLKLAFGSSDSFSVIRSTIAGKVTLIQERPGAMLFSAQKIASVDSAVGGTELEVVAFVAARTGKRVLPGQVVRMSVMGLEPTEFGYLEGEVTEVKPYPVSPDFVERTLAEAALGEASYEVHIRPVKEGSRYRWISGPGADDKVSSNTRVDVSIEVSRQRPYTLVIPWNEDDRRSVAERAATVTPKGSSN